jgi:hypothetical protein
MGRVRMPGRLHGVTKAPDFAWSGWRLRIPGGPEGGQYHGFIAPDSSQSWEGGQGGWPGGRSEIAEGPQKRPSGHSLLPGQGSSYGPWDTNWGGTAFTGGQTHSDHVGREVYRSPSEMRPRPNASGGVNVIRGEQDEATAGFAEAPGNYRGLGMMMAPTTGEPIGVTPYYPPTRGTAVPYVPPSATPPIRYLGPPIPAPGPIAPTYPTPKPSPVVYTGPDVWRSPYLMPLPSPTTIPSAGSGATNVVAQPPQFQSPGPIYMVPWTPPAVSPSPAPVVTASPADYYPSQGQVIDGLTPGTPSAPSAGTSFSDWLSESTIFPSIQNQWILLGVVGAFMLMGGKGKR